MTDLLTPVANILIQQKLDTEDDLVAAPCFNYYPLNVDDGPDKGTPKTQKDPRGLHRSLQDLANAASRISPTDALRESFRAMQVYIKNKIPPE
jgi:hypothetical protein